MSRKIEFVCLCVSLKTYLQDGFIEGQKYVKINAFVVH